MEPVGYDEYLAALLRAPRPNTSRVLAFYEHRVGCIGTDARLLYMPLDDHLCLRGDGLFESFSCRERKILALDRHLQRLQRGAGALQLAPPCSWEEVRTLLLDVARAGGQDQCGLRLLLGRGPGGFGISPAECPQSSLYIVALTEQAPDESFYERGLTAFASSIPPKQDYLAQIKSTNYLPNVLMAQEALEKSMDVAIAFDSLGRMHEAAIASVGIIDQSDRLICPPAERILAGTSMELALDVAEQCGLVPVRQDIYLADIRAAKEMLLFTSASMCVGITHFEGYPVGTGPEAGKTGIHARRLRKAVLSRLLSTSTEF